MAFDRPASPCSLTVLVPTKNEAANLARTLEPLAGWAERVCVIDSNSVDGTQEIARAHGAEVHTFDYRGGWPKKRQWALDTLEFSTEWILLLDADEILTPEARQEIGAKIREAEAVAFRVPFQIRFLGRTLKHGGFLFYKTSLFRTGRARYERRVHRDESAAAADMEIHEHVVADGAVGTLRAAVLHENRNSLHRFIEKHNDYSDWDAQILVHGDAGDVPPNLFGSQAERRRWIRTVLSRLPGFPLLTFAYHYVVRLGFLDGYPGLIYCTTKGIQRFHAKAKAYALRRAADS